MNFVLFVTLLTCYAYSKGFNYTANQKYSYVGKLALNIQNEIQAAGSSNWSNPINITIPYPLNLIYNNNTNLTSLVVLGDYQLQNLTTSGIKIFTLLSQRRQTSMLIKIYATQARYIQKLSISYILVQQGRFFNDFRFYLLQVDNNGLGYDFSTLFSSSTFTVTCTMDPLNFTGGAGSLVFISGMNVKSTSYSLYTQAIQIQMTSEVKSSSLVQIKINSPSRTTSFSLILVSILVYNKAFSNYSYTFPYSFINGIITFNSSNSITYSNSNYQLQKINTFVGLSGFKISSQNVFSYYISVSSNRIDINSNNYYDSATFNILSILTTYCNYNTPYFQQITQLCYTQCPGATLPDNISISCKCYVNSSLVNNSKCFQSEQNIQLDQPSPSSTSSNGMIIGISVGGIALILTIFFLIYFIRRRNINNDNNDNIPSSQQIKKIIYFNQLPIQPYPNLIISQLPSNIQIDKDNIQQPRYHPHITQIQRSQTNPYPSLTYIRQSNFETQIKKDEIWREVYESFSPHQYCRVCNQSRRVFFKSSCSHFFHLSCLSKINNMNCPFCCKSIHQQGIFYCTGCTKKYRKVNFIKDNINNMQILCKNCQNIPL